MIDVVYLNEAAAFKIPFAVDEYKVFSYSLLKTTEKSGAFQKTESLRNSSFLGGIVISRVAIGKQQNQIRQSIEIEGTEIHNPSLGLP